MNLANVIRKHAFATARVFVVAGLMLLNACKPTGNEEAARDSTFSRIRTTKIVKAGYIIYPPTVSVESNAQQPTGFLIDIMNEVAKRAGFAMKYEATTFDDLKLAVGKYDVVIAGVFVNVPRSRDMALTSPIMYWAGVTAIGSAESATRYTHLEDLNKPEIRVAVTLGTAEHDFVKENLPHATINPIPNSDISLTLGEVLARRADVAFADAVTIRKFCRDKPAVSVLFGGRQFTTYATSLAVKSSDLEWLNFLNSALLAMQADGTIRSLNAKYGGEELWRLPKNPWE